MDDSIKTIVKWLLILVVIVGLAYGAYVLYNYAVIDATRRIKEGAAEGVSQGIGEGIGGAVNPVKWFSK